RSPSLEEPEMTVLKGHKNPFGAIEDDSSNEILIDDDSSNESLAAPNSDEKPSGDFRLAAFELLLLRLVAKVPLMVSEHPRNPKPNPSARANTEIRKVLLLVYYFKQLEQILRVENPSKEYRLKLEKLRGEEAQAIISLIDVVISFEPSCVTYNLGNEFVLSLGNGVELAIYQYVANLMPRGNGRKKALAWLRSRGENPDLKILYAAIGRAVAARESVPDKAFGLL